MGFNLGFKGLSISCFRSFWKETVSHKCLPVWPLEQNSTWVRALLGLMHLGLKSDPLCPMIRCYIKGALFLYQSSRWPLYLGPQYPQGPKRQNPDMHVWVRSKPPSHIKWGLRFPPPYHTCYKWGCYSNPLHKDFLLRVLHPGLCHIKG